MPTDPHCPFGLPRRCCNVVWSPLCVERGACNHYTGDHAFRSGTRAHARMDELLSSLSLAEDRDGAASGTEDEAGQKKAMRQWRKKVTRLSKPVKKRKTVQQQRPPPSSPSALASAAAAAFRQPVVAKEARAALFAEWLVRHFGERLMRGDSDTTAAAAAARGTQVAEWKRRSAHSLFIFPSLLDPSATHQPSTAGVVDVAGGKGHLAYLLSTVYHIPAAVIDPRPLNLCRYQAQYQQRLQHMRVRQADSSTPPAGTVPSADGCHLMTHFRCYFPASIPVTHIPHEGTTASPLYSPPPLPSVPTTGSQQPTVHSFVDPTLSSALSTECPSIPLLHSYLSAATLLVGFHADGATEAVVQFALRHNKPFAVVPCCVFCNEGGHRTLPDATDDKKGKESTSNRRVRSYEEFVAYLRAMDDRIQQHTLPFQGRNLCLYMDPHTDSVR